MAPEQHTYVQNQLLQRHRNIYATELSKVMERKSALYIVDKYLDEKVKNRKYVKKKECATWELKNKVTSVH